MADRRAVVTVGPVNELATAVPWSLLDLYISLTKPHAGLYWPAGRAPLLGGGITGVTKPLSGGFTWVLVVMIGWLGGTGRCLHALSLLAGWFLLGVEINSFVTQNFPFTSSFTYVNSEHLLKFSSNRLHNNHFCFNKLYTPRLFFESK